MVSIGDDDHFDLIRVQTKKIKRKACIMEISETLNYGFIDKQYQRWKSDPDSVTKDWQFLFKGFEIGRSYLAKELGLQGNDHHGTLAPLFIGYTDGGRFQNGLMPAHQIFKIE